MFARYIDEFFSRSEPVVVCVCDENQVTPAGVYIESAKAKYPHGDAIVEVTTEANLRTGQKRQGRLVIMYHFAPSPLSGALLYED